MVCMDNKLKEFLKNGNCYLIHYACEEFYAGYGSAPKVFYNMLNDLKQVI